MLFVTLRIAVVAGWRLSSLPYAADANAFSPALLDELRAIRKCKQFTVDNLNRDFVATRGFSVVFRREQVARVVAEFPFFAPSLTRALRPDCNAFYLQPARTRGRVAGRPAHRPQPAGLLQEERSSRCR
jgi:hypothetical protein